MYNDRYVCKYVYTADELVNFRRIWVDCCKVCSMTFHSIHLTEWIHDVTRQAVTTVYFVLQWFRSLVIHSCLYIIITIISLLVWLVIFLKVIGICFFCMWACCQLACIWAVRLKYTKVVSIFIVYSWVLDAISSILESPTITTLNIACTVLIKTSRLS